MVDGTDRISGFENDEIQDGGPIDFTLAQKLGREGSTCEVYVTRCHRRRVFVKRLKAELRSNSVNLAALEKEFEVGVSLQHRSLPEYREFHGDYIVMDYIDGVTLSEMMDGTAEAENQVAVAAQWLRNPANLRRMLRELIEVVGYLHRHNVTHCDIKPDNIILTDGTFNLVLIDLDKSYTSWLDTTSGSPLIYGVDLSRRGNTAIDFHGIGHIITALIACGFKMRGLTGLRDRCFDDGVTADDLLSLIDSYRHPRRLLYLLLPVIVVTIVIIAWLLSSHHTAGPSPSIDSTAQDVIEVADTVATVLNDSLPSLESPQPHSTSRAPVDIEQVTTAELKPLYPELNKLMAMAADSTVAGEALRDSLYNFTLLEKHCISNACKAVGRARKNDESDRKSWEEALMSKSYTDYVRYSDSVQRCVSQEWLRRSPKPRMTGIVTTEKTDTNVPDEL